MVQFTHFDFEIIISMTLFLLFVSFVFPAVGFGAATVNASDIPDFNASEGQFNYVSETPEFPSRPSSGTLEYVENAESSEGETDDNRQVWLRGDSSDGVLISLVEFNGTASPEPEINLIKYNNSAGSPYSENKRINESEYKVLDNFSYVVEFDNVQVENEGHPNMTITTDWNLIQQPSDTSWLGRLPVVGGLVSSASQTAAVLGWVGAVIFQPIYNGMVTVTNTFVALFNIISFIFGFFHWLLSTYGSVIAGAPTAYVGAFAAIPGVLLSFEFVKLLILLIQTILNGIPFT